MRHLDPVLDHSLWQDHIARREATAFYELVIEDVLSEPVEVAGHQFEALAKVWFTKHGVHGDIECHSFELLGPIFIVLPNLSKSQVLLNQNSLQNEHRQLYDLIIKEIMACAIRKASAANDWVMVDDE